jgi:hypothetical protein
MSDIFNKLSNLKGKLADLELNFDQEIKKEEGIEEYKKRMALKMPLIKEMQVSRLKFNVGNEQTIQCAQSTIKNFPFTLTLKNETSNEIFIDSSIHLFSTVLDMIRSITPENVNSEERRKLTVTRPFEAIQVHSKEYFLEDTEKVLNKFEFVYMAPWVKRVPDEKKKKVTNKWGANDYILCYGCSAQNYGQHWKKRCSYDRADDSYCINFYIATCLTCDPDNTKVY